MNIPGIMAEVGPEAITAAAIAVTLTCWAATWLDPRAAHLAVIAIRLTRWV